MRACSNFWITIFCIIVHSGGTKSVKFLHTCYGLFYNVFCICRDFIDLYHRSVFHSYPEICIGVFCVLYSYKLCNIGGEFRTKIIFPQLKQLAICVMMRENAASLHELLCDFPRFWNGTASGTNEMMRADGFIEQKPATFPVSKHVTFPNAFSPIITDKLLQLLQFLDRMSL